jgi:hypothetical protein
MTRWAYQPPIKRAPFYHAHHCSSGVWNAGTALADKTIGAALKSVGENRQAVVQWLKGLLTPSAAGESFLLMDSTHMMSVSEHPEVNAKGCNNSFDFGKQLRLMYLFSAKMKLPVYYRLLGGNGCGGHGPVRGENGPFRRGIYRRQCSDAGRAESAVYHSGQAGQSKNRL